MRPAVCCLLLSLAAAAQTTSQLEQELDAYRRVLPPLGAAVTLVCRSRERGENAAAAIRDATGNPRAELAVCDVVATPPEIEQPSWLK